MAEVRIERLKNSDKKVLLDLFDEAFTAYPLIPTLTDKPKARRKVLKAFLDFFGGKKSFMHGIKKNDKILCASVSVDSKKEPSIFSLFRFIISLSFALGRKAKELEIVHKEEPKYEERYLELVLLGTLPEHQRKGFGRMMLRFLKDFARKEGYKGIILVADVDTPAFNFYLKERFLADKEFEVGKTKLCWMRFTLENLRYPCTSKTEEGCLDVLV